MLLLDLFRTGNREFPAARPSVIPPIRDSGLRSRVQPPGGRRRGSSRGRLGRGRQFAVFLHPLFLLPLGFLPGLLSLGRRISFDLKTQYFFYPFRLQIGFF